MTAPDHHQNAIAIIGMQARFPGAPSLEAFWELLRGGREAVRHLSEAELHAAGVPERLRRAPGYVGATAQLPDIDRFDAGFFGLSPMEAEVMDPQLRLLLECAWAALEDAGYDPETFPGPIGVCGGASVSGYLHEHVLKNRERVRDVGGLQVNIANAVDTVASLLAYKLNLTGPCFTVQTACSTSLAAVHLACQSLLSGECDMALAGGVSVKVQALPGYIHQEGGILSRDGRTRAFDAQASGTVMGSGVGLVVLRRLADALEDGDTIHAVILGSAVNNDGSAKGGYTAPSVTGHARVVAEALGMARVAPDSIGYLEAHGTGTVLGDPIEIEGLTRAFREGTDRVGFCAIGSVKTNLGHLDHAAGIASLVKTVLALQHAQIPPSLHFEQPNPKIDFDSSPFRVSTKLTEWTPGDSPRRAGVSSLGMGGTNVHVVLEEAPPAAARAVGTGFQLLPLSARSEEALEQATDRLASHLRALPELPLEDVAHTLQVGRRRFSCRRVVVCEDAAEAARALETRDPERLATALLQPPSARPVFLFPGQGAQHAGMARGVYQRFGVFRSELDACCERLLPLVGLDLRRLLLADRGDAEAARQLDETRLAQPALFAVEYSLARLWAGAGVHPERMIGHSVGEYVAACLSGVLERDDALALLALRGRLMQEQPRGAMLAVPLPAVEVEARLSPELAVAAVNAPASSVVSGPATAVEALASELRADGIETRRLRTSHAFHSPMMDAVIGPFSEAVARLTLGAPRIPYVSNLTGRFITDKEARDPGYWGRHLRSPVRFAEGLGALLEGDDLALVEVGPGQILGGLLRQHPARRPGQAVVFSLPHKESAEAADRCLLMAAGKLWLSGARLDWTALGPSDRPRRIPLPTYPFERRRYWLDRPDGDPEGRRRPGAMAPLEKQSDVASWLHVPRLEGSAALPPPKALGQRPPSRFLVLGGEEPLSAGLVAYLRRAGHTVVEVRAGASLEREAEDRYRVDPEQPGHYREALGRLAGPAEGPLQVLHLWTIDPAAATTEVALRRGLHSLLLLVQAIGAERLGSARLRVVSTGLVDLGGGGVVSPGRATLLGLCAVVRQEHPQLECGLIDLSLLPGGEDRALGALVDELARDPVEPMVALRDGLRFRTGFEPLPAGVGSDARLREEGVYLITGGLGRLGLHLAEHLARRVRARLVLTGRSGLPPRGQGADPVQWRRRAVEDLGALGSEVLVLAADAADEDEMREALLAARRRFGRIDGVIHAAGVLERASCPLRDLSVAECGRQLRPKVEGVEVLARVLEGEDPDFVLLMSSLSAVLGGLGYGAYAAANAFMDAFVEAQHARGRRSWISVGWDSWQDPAPDAQRRQSEASRLSMTPAEGTAVLDRILGLGPVRRVVVSTADLPSRIARWTRPAAAAETPAEAPAASRHPRPNLQRGYVAPETPTEKRLSEIWGRLLGIDRVGLHDNFFELGGTSLVAVQMVSQVREAFDTELSVAAVFEGPTVHSFCRLILEGAATGGALVTASSPAQE